jgi:hypothetical protein
MHMCEILWESKNVLHVRDSGVIVTGAGHDASRGQRVAAVLTGRRVYDRVVKRAIGGLLQAEPTHLELVS